MAKLQGQDHVDALSVEGTADEQMRRLTGTDARECVLEGGDARAFFTHIGARGTGDLVDDGDVAGEQVRQLCQE